MATIISDEIRNALKANGVWHDFVRRRDDVKSECGIGTTSANRMVLSEFAEDGKIPADLVPKVRPRGNPNWKRNCDDVGFSAAAVPIADVRIAAKDARKSAEACNAPKPVMPTVTKDTFAGKSCDNAMSVIWAITNVVTVDVTPDDAPSGLAWSYLCHMRESISSKADIMRQVAAKIVAKAEIDCGNGDSWDGEAEYNLCETLAKGGEQ